MNQQLDFVTQPENQGRLRGQLGHCIVKTMLQYGIRQSPRIRAVGRQQEDSLQGSYALYSQEEAVQIKRFFCLIKGLSCAP